MCFCTVGNSKGFLLCGLNILTSVHRLCSLVRSSVGVYLYCETCGGRVSMGIYCILIFVKYFTTLSVAQRRCCSSARMTAGLSEKVVEGSGLDKI